MRNIDLGHIAIMQGRYNDGWFAIANADEHLDLFEPGVDGPWGDDQAASDFWKLLPEWAAYGSTPDEAVRNLEAKWQAQQQPGPQ